MKKIIMLAMVSVMMLVSMGGCWAGLDEGGRDGRDRGHERDEGHDRDEGHEERH